MGENRRRRGITAWIAIFAVLLASLAPSISHALAATGWTGYLDDTEFCSADSTDSNDSAVSQLHDAHAHHEHQGAPTFDDHRLHFEHCPFCFTHAGTFGTPPVPEFVVPLLVGSAVLPNLFLHSPRLLFIWAAPQARAPPVFL